MFFEGRGQYRMQHGFKEFNAYNFMSTLTFPNTRGDAEMASSFLEGDVQVEA